AARPVVRWAIWAAFIRISWRRCSGIMYHTIAALMISAAIRCARPGSRSIAGCLQYRELEVIQDRPGFLRFFHYGPLDALVDGEHDRGHGHGDQGQGGDPAGAARRGF